MLLEIVKKEIDNVIKTESKYNVFYTEHIEHGHITTNIAMIIAKDQKENPVQIAHDIIRKILNSNQYIFKKVEVAGPGFINFTFNDVYMSDLFTKSNLDNINQYIKNKNINNLNQKNILVEYTDPNPFKVFHIGHLMTNIIGESIASIYELAGAAVKRINYQGDIGRHIAINIYAILKPENKIIFEDFKINNTKSIKEKVVWLGQKYAEGYADFDKSIQGDYVHNQITDINRKIYEKSDPIINDIYNFGREWSLEYFETLYKMLGTKFDKYIFESECSLIGLNIVKNNIENNIFEVGEESAIIFNGEKCEPKLHKRVFINKNGLPTYEAKDLGNMTLKLNEYTDIYKSIVVTGAEQIDYFKVLYRVIEELYPNLKNKMVHYGHGMMRFADSKMSSRNGNIIAGDDLIDSIKEKLNSKFEESRVVDKNDKAYLIEKVAIASIKYAVLRQAIGRDIIFDIDKVISTEGDSGPYLQYTHARFCSVANNYNNKVDINKDNEVLILTLLKYSDVLCEVVTEVSPQKLVTYMTDLCRISNSWYATNRIVSNIQNEYIASNIASILGHGMSIIKIHAPKNL